MGKTNAAFADWNESKLTSDSTLNNLQVLSGGKVKVSGASSLNKRQVLNFKRLGAKNQILRRVHSALLNQSPTLMK